MYLPATHRLSQNALNGPSFFDPLDERLIADACSFAPSHDWQRQPAERQEESISLVPVLFGAGSPSAIFGGVRAIIVDPVDAVLGRRARSHVGVEAGKVRPLRADGNAPLGVACISRIRRPTALMHPCPDAVLRASTDSASILESTAHARRRSLACQTSARSRVVTQARTSDGTNLTAVAPADPAYRSVPRPVLVLVQDSESTEALTRFVGDTMVGHRSYSFGVTPRGISSTAGALPRPNFTTPTR